MWEMKSRMRHGKGTWIRENAEGGIHIQATMESRHRDSMPSDEKAVYRAELGKEGNPEGRKAI
jgi:hypothetical protein